MTSARAPAGDRTVATRPWVILVLVVLAAAGLRVLDANPASAQTTALTAWSVDADPGMDATTGVWRDVPGVEVALSAQNVTFPRGGAFGDLQRPVVTAKALHVDDTLYVALRWKDSSVDDRTDAPERFADAAAVQFPATPESSVPAVCMGQADQSVNIWHWRADSQAGVPDRPTRGYVDEYPSTSELFYPARAAGNPYASVEAGAVQNLVAGGFGTLTPLDEQAVSGLGTRDGGSWSTVFKRAYAAPGEFQPTFASGQSIDVAFAVWDGARNHRNGIKSVTSFVRMDISSEPAPSDNPFLRAVLWVVYAVLLVGAIALLFEGPRPRRKATT